MTVFSDRTKQGDSLSVYSDPPAPLPMSHGCMNCGRPFPEHEGDELLCPTSASNRPYADVDFDDEGFVLACTHCGGEGTCDANSDPLGNCGEDDHPCHACCGSGDRRDQRIF